MEKRCPDCYAPLIEDYWDTVERQPDGSYMLDAFEALVCENRCGYYERL